MSISLLNDSDVAAMRRAGAAAAATLRHIGEQLIPGISTEQIDRWVRAHTQALGGIPSQFGFHGFPASVCVSRNEVVCHGVPSKNVRLQDGDIVNIDITTCLDGFHGDCSATFMIGRPSQQAQRLVEVAREARDLGVRMIAPGTRVGDIGAAIEQFVRSQGCTSVREFGGHGIGRHMHQAPHIPFVGPKGVGPKLRPGMAITIEPMVNMGGPQVEYLADGWTVVTRDRSWSAQFEHTVLVTETGYEILTV